MRSCDICAYRRRLIEKAARAPVKTSQRHRKSTGTLNRQSPSDIALYSSRIVQDAMGRSRQSAP